MTYAQFLTYLLLAAATGGFFFALDLLCIMHIENVKNKKHKLREKLHIAMLHKRFSA